MVLKVLCLTSCFPVKPDGKNFSYIWDSLEAIKKLGIHPVVLHTKTWRFQPSPIDYKSFSVPIESCHYLSVPRHYFRSFSNYSYLWRIVPKIYKLHDIHQFDLIHAHGEISGLAAIAASRKLKIPAVVTIHGIDTCKRLSQGHAAKMFHSVFHQANKIIYVGEPLQKYFDNITNASRRCVVHNGFKLPIAKKSERARDPRLIRIISVSFLHEGKGVDLTLQALGELKKMGIENWNYTIIGAGYLKKHCEKIVNKFELEKKVIFMGEMDHHDVYSQLADADIFCLPSYREAFGIAYLEAMAHGLLTIGVQGQGPEAFIQHKKTGFLVKPQNLNHLIETLHTTIMHFDAMRKIALTGKQYVLEHFTWNKHAEKLHAIYKEVRDGAKE